MSEDKKRVGHAPLGIVSLSLGLVFVAQMILVTFIESPFHPTTLYLFDWSVASAGVIVGIFGLVDYGKKRLFAVLGILLHLVVAILLAVLLAFLWWTTVIYS